jgi:signal transduction histidine kinase
MPRSLGGRVVAAFLAVSVVVLLAAGGALFVVLRGLHADATTASLEDVAGSVVPQVRDAIGGGDLRGTLLEVSDTLAARGIDVMVVGADGRLRPIAGTPEGDPILASDLSAGATAHGRTTIDGTAYLWVAAGIRRAAAVAPRAIAFVTQDRSAGQALADVVRALPIVLLVTVLVAAPLAWLLSRSITRPLRRLARAATTLPGSGHVALAPEGPAEVRELTTTFNGMADELEETRRRESELLANLRHDLRTPLTVISGFATALRDGTATGDSAAAAARAIEEEAARLEHLVDELGDVERLRTGDDGLRPEPLDLVALAESAVERFRDRAARAGLTLELAPPPAGFDGRIVADRVALDRMLGNLVSNAIAASEGGGRVRLELADTMLDGRPAMAIDVVDDGKGFPPGGEARAFERFWRGDSSRVGTGSGLGLAIVRELAQAHGGQARASNALPNGARVGIVLPRAAGA